jgi:hypothetical protein
MLGGRNRKSAIKNGPADQKQRHIEAVRQINMPAEP